MMKWSAANSKSNWLLTLSPEVIRSFDPEGRMFMNVNTPEDLRNLSSR